MWGKNLQRLKMGENLTGHGKKKLAGTENGPFFHDSMGGRDVKTGLSKSLKSCVLPCLE